uniref:RNA-dependent RNA polymerase n=1 Tax=Alexandrium monilatum TaxID=311494 RepID=A0A7S4Q0T0_9DINO
MFSVIWAEDLVPPAGLMQPALDYDALLREAGEPVGTMGSLGDEDLVHFFCRVVVNDTLGKIAHMHLALCDASPQGALEPLAMEMAKAQSLAVDFPKTGVPPQVPTKAIKEVECRGYPDFMQKPQRETYTSEKVLGALFRRCVSLDVDHEAASPFDVDEALLLPGRSAWRSAAVAACARFRHELGRLLVCHGLRHEAEAVLAAALRWPATSADRGKASARIRRHFDALTQKYRAEFLEEELGDADRWAKASAWYEAAYRPAEQRSARPCRSFAWVAGDVLCEIKRRGGGAPGPKIDVQTLIGMSARDEALEAVPLVQQTVASRMAVAARVQHALDPAPVRAAERAFSVRPFGSVALCLCEAESDLDVCVVASAGAFSPPFVPAGQGAHFAQLDAAAQARHFLQVVVSPAVDTVARLKRELLNAHVPIVRCSVAGVLDSAEDVRVDITFCQEGLLKARHFCHVVHSRGPVVFAAVMLLTRWGRAVGLVRSAGGHTAAGESGAGQQGPPAASEAAMVPAEWQALLLHLIATDHGVREALDAGARPVLGADTADAEQHQGTAEAAEDPEAFLRRFSDGLAAMRRRDARALGALLLALLRGTSCLRGAVDFAWPVQGTPRHRLAPEVLAAAALRAARAVQVLTATRSFGIVLAAGAAAVETSISRRLSRTLCFRLYNHRAFHEAHLHAVSGAAVRLEPVEDSELLLLHAAGSAAQVDALQRELHRYATAALAVGMPSTKASRYFMEGSTCLLFEGTSSMGSRLRFEPSSGGHVPAHAASERMAPCLNLAECDSPWEAVAQARFLDLWSAQLAKVPLDSHSHMSSLTARVRFGSFYLTDVSDKLPETSMTMSIGELQEAMSKHKRNRKTCFRAPTDCAPSEPLPRPGDASFQMTQIRPSKGLAGVEPQRGRRKHRRAKQPGIGSSFCPGLLPGNAPAEALRARCAAAYAAALRRAGFCQVQATVQKAGSLAAGVYASQAFELEVRLDPELRVLAVSERPLCWVHATLVRSRCGLASEGARQQLLRTHDVRVKVETTDPVQPGSRLLEVALPGGRAPVGLRGQIPVAAEHASPWLRDRLGYARRCDQAVAFERQLHCRGIPAGARVRAEVISGAEFMGKGFVLRRDFCELGLALEPAVLGAAVRHGRTATRNLGEQLWRVALEVSAALMDAAREG